MSKINPKRAYTKEIIESFSGLGAHGASLSEAEHTPVNFRIRKDGSLEKRCGWRIYESFTQGKLRGTWQGVLKGNTLRFVVCGSTVLRINGTTRSIICTLPTHSGEVNFFVYCKTEYS